MGFEFQGIPNGALPGDQVTFNFENPVLAYALGFGAITMTYGSTTDHYVQDFSLSLSSSQPVSATPNQVVATVEATLSDASGHSIDRTSSYLYPVCVAFTGSLTSSDPVLTNVKAIPNNSAYPVTIPATPQSLVSFMAGFALDYASGDHRLLKANAGCGITANGTQGSVSASATLSDNTGHIVNTATVDAGVLASPLTTEQSGPAIQAVQGQTTQPVEVDFSSQLSAVSEVWILIQSWKVQYDNVQNVQTFKAGSFGPCEIKGTTVTLRNLYASVNDNHNHYQDNSNSYVDVLVFALGSAPDGAHT